MSGSTTAEGRGEDAEDRHRQRDRVRDRERGDLHKDRPELRAEQVDTHHEQNMVETPGQDVREAEPHVVAHDLPAGGSRDVGDLEPVALQVPLHPMRDQPAVTAGEQHRVGIDHQAVCPAERRGALRDDAPESHRAERRGGRVVWPLGRHILGIDLKPLTVEENPHPSREHRLELGESAIAGVTL